MIPRSKKGKMVPTRHVSNKQESRAARNLGLKKQPNSGATAFAKGDLVGADILLECKTKMKVSSQITLKREWFETLIQEKIAMRKSLIGVLFDFGDGKNYVAIPEKDFKDYLRLRELEETGEL